MEIGSKLSTVVAPTHEVSLAALVTIMSTAVKRSIAISLSQATGLLGSTAPPPVVVTAPTPLTQWRSQWSPGHDDWRRGLGKVLGQVTAVVLLVVVRPELLTVVTPTHQVSLAASVSVMASSISRSITVSLS